MEEKVQKAVEDNMRVVAMSLERAKLADYVQLMNSPWRLIWLNFVAGLARGVGLAIGGSLLVGLLLYVLSQIAVLNLPLISDVIAEIVQLVQMQLR